MFFHTYTWFRSSNVVLKISHILSAVNYVLASVHLLFWCRFTNFGGAVPYRPAEDLAFSIARFIQKGGSFVNYYMVILNTH